LIGHVEKNEIKGVGFLGIQQDMNMILNNMRVHDEKHEKIRLSLETPCEVPEASPLGANDQPSNPECSRADWRFTFGETHKLLKIPSLGNPARIIHPLFTHFAHQESLWHHMYLQLLLFTRICEGLSDESPIKEQHTNTLLQWHWYCLIPQNAVSLLGSVTPPRTKVRGFRL
jgi:hypothetical protein